MLLAGVVSNGNPNNVLNASVSITAWTLTGMDVETGVRRGSRAAPAHGGGRLSPIDRPCDWNQLTAEHQRCVGSAPPLRRVSLAVPWLRPKSSTAAADYDAAATQATRSTGGA